MEPERTAGSTLGELARTVQGLVLERLAIGVVLIGLVDIVAAFLEAEGARRALAAVIGIGIIVVALIGWRHRWSDPVMWGATLLSGTAGLAAFVLAVA